VSASTLAIHRPANVHASGLLELQAADRTEIETTSIQVAGKDIVFATASTR